MLVPPSLRWGKDEGLGGRFRGEPSPLPAALSQSVHTLPPPLQGEHPLPSQTHSQPHPAPTPPAADHDGPRRRPVQQDGKVHLPLQLHLLGDVERVDRLAGRPRLLGDQRAAQHLLGELDGARRGADVDAALEAAGELAQAAAAGEDLALEDDLRGVGGGVSGDARAAADGCASASGERRLLAAAVLLLPPACLPIQLPINGYTS